MSCQGYHGHLQEFDSSVPPFSMRRLLSNTNGKLLDAILRHRHFVLRAENSVIKEVLKPLNAAEKQIKGDIARIAALGGGGSDFSQMRLGQLQQMEALIQRAMVQARELTGGIASAQMTQFALKEFEIQDALLRRIIPNGISLELGGGSPSRALQILSEPLGGRFWGDRLDDDFRALEIGWRQDLATSFALGEGIDQAVTRLSTSTDNVGRARLTTIARTEMQRVANRAAMDQYSQNRDVIKAVQIIETLDDRTCFPAGTSVLTPGGEVDISSLSPGDMVIGGSGFPRRVIAARKKPYSGAFTSMAMGNRTLVGTSDHRVGTAGGWKDLGSIGISDRLVVLKEVLNAAPGAPIIDPGLLHAEDFDALGFDLRIPPGIPSRIVPVGPVCLNRETQGRNKEVDGVASNLPLLLEGNRDRFQYRSDITFECSLALEGSVTPEATEAAGANASRDCAELFAAVVTVHEDGRASADLGAMGMAGATEAETLPAPLAIGVGRSGGAALYRTDVEAVGVGRGDFERLLADRASLRDPIRDRIEVALAGAELGPISCPNAGGGEEDAPAMLTLSAPIGDVLPFVLKVASLRAEFPVSLRNWVSASGTWSIFHTLNLGLQQPVIKRFEDTCAVYDIQVEEDESFWAEGVLVHNCLICAVLDGQLRRVGSGDIPPFHPNCRGFIVPVTRSLEEMGLNPDDFPPSVQSVLNGEPSDRVVYSDWFDGQSAAFQKQQLGPTRFGLFNSGELEINDFVDVKDLRILPVASLPMMSLQP